MPPTTYSLQDYQEIKTDFKLPSTVLEIIQQLSNKFGVSIVSSTSTTTTRPIRKNGNRIQDNDMQWQTMRDLKPTVVLDKQNKMNDIRVALNKLSQKNYDITSEFIIDKLHETVKENDDEQIQKTIQTNKFIFFYFCQTTSVRCPQVLHQIEMGIISDTHRITNTPQ